MFQYIHGILVLMCFSNNRVFSFIVCLINPCRLIFLVYAFII